jgi:hypothetical protein
LARQPNGGKHPGDNSGEYYQPPQRQRPDATQMMTLGGIGVLLMISFGNWREIDRIHESLDNRLGRLETQIAQRPNRTPTPAAAPARGPDPNRVYAIKMDGAPSKGPANAPVVIAEFSDFQ